MEEVPFTVRSPTSTYPGETRFSDLIEVVKDLIRSNSGQVVQLGFYLPPMEPTEEEVQFQEIMEASARDGELSRNENLVLDLPSIIWSEEDEKEKVCAICQSSIEVGERVSKLNCDHIHHYYCLQDWGKYKHECPVCRSDIPVLER